MKLAEVLLVKNTRMKFKVWFIPFFGAFNWHLCVMFRSKK